MAVNRIRGHGSSQLETLSFNISSLSPKFEGTGASLCNSFTIVTGIYKRWNSANDDSTVEIFPYFMSGPDSGSFLPATSTPNRTSSLDVRQKDLYCRYCQYDVAKGVLMKQSIGLAALVAGDYKEIRVHSRSFAADVLLLEVHKTNRR